MYPQPLRLQKALLVSRRVAATKYRVHCDTVARGTDVCTHDPSTRSGSAVDQASVFRVNFGDKGQGPDQLMRRGSVKVIRDEHVALFEAS